MKDLFAVYLLSGYRAGHISRAQVRNLITYRREQISYESRVARSGSCNPCGGGYMINSRGGYRENFGGA